jgi:tetratricopeptide (TPR) repeat protein
MLHTLFAQTVSSEMDAGVEAYKSAMYERAIAHFRKATELDPNLAAAHIYLATAYAQMYIPGAESPDNLQNAENSLADFKRALESNPPPEQRIHTIQGWPRSTSTSNALTRRESITTRSSNSIPRPTIR